MIPLLLVLIPLCTGLLCWRLHSAVVMERLNLLAFIIVSTLALYLASQVLLHGAIESFDGFLRVDALSALVIALTAFVALVCAVYAVGYLREEERAGKVTANLRRRY